VLAKTNTCMDVSAKRLNNRRMDTIMPTVAAILDRYQREVVPELHPRTQRDYAYHIGYLKRDFGDWVAAELKPKDFAEYFNVKRGRMGRVRTLAVLSAAFNCAVRRWFWLETNVLRDVMRPKSKPRDRLIGDDEFEAMKATAYKPVQLAMMLALYTGQRQGDIISFKWSDLSTVTVDGRTYDQLYVYQSKTRKRIGIEVGPQLEAVLDQCWEFAPRKDKDATIIQTRHGAAYTSAGFRALWQRAMNRWCRAGGSRYRFHDIRGLAATKCRSLEEARALLGHIDSKMTLRVYRRGIERVKSLQLGA
jgi:integrase